LDTPKNVTELQGIAGSFSPHLCLNCAIVFFDTLG